MWLTACAARSASDADHLESHGRKEQTRVPLGRPGCHAYWCCSLARRSLAARRGSSTRARRSPRPAPRLNVPRKSSRPCAAASPARRRSSRSMNTSRPTSYGARPRAMQSSILSTSSPSSRGENRLSRITRAVLGRAAVAGQRRGEDGPRHVPPARREDFGRRTSKRRVPGCSSTTRPMTAASCWSGRSESRPGLVGAADARSSSVAARSAARSARARAARRERGATGCARESSGRAVRHRRGTRGSLIG